MKNKRTDTEHFRLFRYSQFLKVQTSKVNKKLEDVIYLAEGKKRGISEGPPDRDYPLSQLGQPDLVNRSSQTSRLER